MYYETLRISSKYSISINYDSLNIIRIIDSCFEKITIHRSDGYVHIIMGNINLKFHYPPHLATLMIGRIIEIIEYEKKRSLRDTMLIEEINNIIYEFVKYYYSEILQNYNLTDNQ